MRNCNAKRLLVALLLSTPPFALCYSSTTRRQWMQRVLGTISASSAGFVAATEVTNAACLPGDLSPSCIGVYKVPIDDRVLPYVSTPEALSKFAPDLKYVPPIQGPDNVSQAWEILETQRLAADDIIQVVSAGRLEEAGIKVLNLVPRITTSGRLLMDTIETQVSKGTAGAAINELKILRLQSQWDLALGLWGETDIMIGQGLRGDLGVSAVAQIQIITQLKEATAALDDFLASAAVESKPPNSSKS